MTLTRRQLNPTKVRAARQAAGSTALAAAEAAQLTPQGYYRWENAQRGPLTVFDRDRAELLAAHLQVTLDDLTDPLPTPAQASA